MRRRFRAYECAVLLAAAFGCQCNDPNVETKLKPEGVACADDAECETGLCEALPGEERKCTRKCTAGCLENEICEPLAPDRYACVPDKAALCAPCETDADCPYPADRCIQVAGVNVCGRDCSFDATCPDTFTCADAEGFDGSILNSQCQPQSGTCECTAQSDGQTVPCESTNAFGTCTGVKTCKGDTGYSTCSAPVPTEELCNGIDDDCDGETDENLGDTMCGQGECLRIVSNCANGEVQACVPGMPSTEVCDEKDNDCDLEVDEGFDKQSNVENCGTCGNDCGAQLTAAQPHGAAACSGGQCALNCDPGWGDCDAVFQNGCETDVYNDMQHCGGCFLKCDPTNAMAMCVMGVCSAACAPGYANCDMDWANGCEVNTTNDVMNCGGCGTVCAGDHATPACVNSLCELTCDTDWWDLDGDPANGCEYNCVFQSATDIPDLGFVDANCDGIDGEVLNGIFVAPLASGGSDTNPGTRAQPKRTLAGGMSAAVATGKRDLYIAAGTYTEQAKIEDPGKGLFGGYQAGTWARSQGNAVTVTGVNTPLFIDGATGAMVQMITFLGSNALGSGQTAYGAMIRGSQNVTLASVTIVAGDGTAGASGSAAQNGAGGLAGSPGRPGCEDSDFLCSSCSKPSGGAGGTSPCGRTGGVGGSPGHSGGAGSNGGTGVGGTPGGLGRGCCAGNTTPPSYTWGDNGANGSPGSPGSNGASFGSVTAAGYTRAATSDGAPGGDGSGGGGGGGGGGGNNNCDSYGGSGGGGGGGGCGGEGGNRGISGGASIGLFLYTSSVTAEDTLVEAGNGGDGGDGSSGGVGGPGGPGGGDSPYGGSDSQDDGSNGARGGKGGNGGSGGAGGAGGGGPSLGVVRVGLSNWNPVGATAVTVGSAGQGGNSATGGGADGTAQATYP